MDIKSVLQKVMERPWILAAALILGYFVLRPSGSRQIAGFDPSATLQSQQIATSANVQLAGISAAMHQTDADNNAMVAAAMKDVILGAQQFAALDRTLSVQQQIESSKAAQYTVDTTANVVTALFDRLMGHREAVIGLNNQAFAINNSLLANKMGAKIAELNSQNDRASIESDLTLGLRTLDVNSDLTKYSLPFEERMQLQEQETVRNLAWRAKQIAKYQANSNLFGSLIQGGFGLLNKGADFAITKAL